MKIESLGDYQMLINDKGDIVYPPVADRIVPVGENLFAVLYNGNYGIVNKFGRYVIPSVFEDAAAFSHGLIKMIKGYSFYYFNKLGVLIYMAPYVDEASDYDGEKIDVTNYDEDEYTHERQIAHGEVRIDSITEPQSNYSYLNDLLKNESEKVNTPSTKQNNVRETDSPKQNNVREKEYRQSSIFDVDNNL